MRSHARPSRNLKNESGRRILNYLQFFKQIAWNAHIQGIGVIQSRQNERANVDMKMEQQNLESSPRKHRCPFDVCCLLGESSTVQKHFPRKSQRWCTFQAEASRVLRISVPPDIRRNGDRLTALNATYVSSVPTKVPSVCVYAHMGGRISVSCYMWLVGMSTEDSMQNN